MIAPAPRGAGSEALGVKAVVTGMIATYPVGGVAWDYGQYALGLQRLGFDVTYLEDTGHETYDPRAATYGPDPSYAVGFLEAALARLVPGLGGRWHFRAADGSVHGMDAPAAARAVAEADVFLNVSGSALLRPEYLPSRRKVLVDTDPAWNHFVNWPKWDRGEGWEGVESWRAHDHFFTYAERIGKPDCVLPSLGVSWRPTRPPVVMDQWTARPPGDRWTTVMTWDNFRRPVEHDGRVYGTKEREFAKVEEIPKRLPEASFEVAVGGDPPVDRWREIGWSVVDAPSTSVTPEAYREYVEGSRAEVSVAKNLYVATRSGWFSCRSACYLAAGRPVVLQDTGWSEVIPAGEGLLAFEDAEGAAAGVAAVERDYARHAEAARRVAGQHLASDVVLGRLLEEVGLR
jgi:hypothetical protein